jgi:hypothetical protein
MSSLPLTICFEPDGGARDYTRGRQFYNEGGNLYALGAGEAILWRYGGADASAVIPNRVNGYLVTQIGDCAFAYNKTLKSVAMSNSVVSVGDRAFIGCEKLNDITMPDNLAEIGVETFKGCVSLTRITIPENVAHIGRDAFYGCTGLSSVEILSGGVGESMFYNCASLTEIRFGEMVAKIGKYAFGNCISVSAINAPDSVTDVEYAAFRGCDGLEALIVNNPDVKFNNPFGDKYTPPFLDREAPEGIIIPPHLDLEQEMPEEIAAPVIYAFNGSAAQRYARNREIDFIPIVKVTLDGRQLRFDVPPVIVDDRVLVPMRAIFEQLGAEVSWRQETRTVVAKTGNKTVTMQIDNTQMQVGDAIITLDVPPQILMERTLAPLRAVSESLGAAVEWDEASQTVTITSAPPAP